MPKNTGPTTLLSSFALLGSASDVIKLCKPDAKVLRLFSVGRAARCPAGVFASVAVANGISSKSDDLQKMRTPKGRNFNEYLRKEQCFGNDHSYAAQTQQIWHTPNDPDRPYLFREALEVTKHDYT